MVTKILVDPQIKGIAHWGILVNKLLRDPRFEEGDEGQYDIVFTRDPEFVRKHLGAPVLIPEVLPFEEEVDLGNDLIERIRGITGTSVSVSYLSPLGMKQETLQTVQLYEPKIEDKLASLGWELGRALWRAEKTENPAENEQYMRLANDRFKRIRLEFLTPEARKFMIPLGIPGKYSEAPEGGVFSLHETDLVVKKIRGSGGLSAIVDAQMRYEAAKRHRGKEPLRPPTIYPPLQDGQDVWLISQQIRGKTVSEILTILGEEKAKERQDAEKVRRINNAAAEIIGAHVDSLLYWITHETGFTSPDDVRRTYIERANEVPQLLRAHRFTRSGKEEELWYKCIEVLLDDLDIPEKTIVPRRDAVWDNGLASLTGSGDESSHIYSERSGLVDMLVTIPVEKRYSIRDRYHGIDMGAGGDSILMEIAKFRVAPEGEPFEEYVKLHANRVLEQAAEIKKFNRGDIHKTTEQLIFAYRALRKMVLTIGVFSPRAQAEFDRLHDAGILERGLTREQQMKRYIQDARWCAIYGMREFSRFAYDMLEMPSLGSETRATHLQAAILYINSGSRRVILARDIAPNGNVLLLDSDRAARYLDFLSRPSGKRAEYESKQNAAAALFVASYLYRFYTQEIDRMDRKIGNGRSK